MDWLVYCTPYHWYFNTTQHIVAQAPGRVRRACLPGCIKRCILRGALTGSDSIAARRNSLPGPTIPTTPSSTNAMSKTQEESYNAGHVEYDALDLLPMGFFHTQLGAYALGDCTGMTILDLGGGSGLHARTAIDQGATRVDVVDLSPGMMANGISNEARLGREDRIRWYEGDISKPLDKLPLSEGYDVTMVNWTFDHAESVQALEAMWENTSAYTKPGGKLISIRMTSE